MNTLHILCLTAAAVLVAATSAGSANLRRRGEDLPLIGHIIGWSLMIGNAASLLPAAPAWYEVVMVALSVAGIAWFLISVTSNEARTTAAQLASRDIYAGRVPGTPVRPALRLIKGEVVDAAPKTAAPTLTVAPAPAAAPTAPVVSKATAEDKTAGHPSVSGPRPTLTVADQATFAAYGPAGSTAAMGATYVAADIDNYIDAAGTRRAHGRHVSRSHTKMDPTERFLRLADAYSIDRGPRSLGRSHLA